MQELTHLKRPWCLERFKVEEKEMTEDEMARWHHWLSGHEFEQAPWDCEGHGGLACCSPWGRKDLDTTEQMNNKNYLGHKSKEKWSQMQAQYKNINSIDIKYRYRKYRFIPRYVCVYIYMCVCVCVCMCVCVCVTKVLHPGCIKIYLTYMQNTSCKMPI